MSTTVAIDIPREILHAARKLLASREMALHYDLDDYEQDIKTLHDIGRR